MNKKKTWESNVVDAVYVRVVVMWKFREVGGNFAFVK